MDVLVIVIAVRGVPGEPRRLRAGLHERAGEAEAVRVAVHPPGTGVGRRRLVDRAVAVVVVGGRAELGVGGAHVALGVVAVRVVRDVA